MCRCLYEQCSPRSREALQAQLEPPVLALMSHRQGAEAVQQEAQKLHAAFA